MKTLTDSEYFGLIEKHEERLVSLRTEIAHWKKLADQWQAAEGLASKDADTLRARAERAEEKLAAMPSDWFTDASLETWFPLTAKSYAKLHTKNAEISGDRDMLRAEIAALKEERGGCEVCGLVAWINNGDCNDLCAFCKMRERAERAEKERDFANNTIWNMGNEAKGLRGDIRDLRARLEASERSLWVVTEQRKDAVRVGDMLRARLEEMTSERDQLQANYAALYATVCKPASDAPAPSDPTDAPEDAVALLENQIRMARMAHAATGAVDDSPEIEQMVQRREKMLLPQPADGARDTAAGKETL